MQFTAGVPKQITTTVPLGSHSVAVNLTCADWPAGDCLKVSIDWANEPGCSSTYAGQLTDRRGNPVTSINMKAYLPAVGDSTKDVVSAIITLLPLQDISSDMTIAVV